MSADEENEDVSVDPLLERLRDKYSKQRSEQLARRKKRLEKELNTKSVKNNALPPSVELLSDDTVHAFNDLEALLTSQTAALEQLRAIRAAVNKELRQCLSYFEEGYSSAFQTLLSEAQLVKNRRGSGEESGAQSPSRPSGDGERSPPRRTPRPASQLSAHAPKGQLSDDAAAAAVAATPGAARATLLAQCPAEWQTAKKNTVVNEMQYQTQHYVKKLPRKLTVQEALSSITGLFAESLAALLFCEVVRIYLYDENGSLHCCATFPSSAEGMGDPMRATYTEIMLAKDLHNSVCSKGIAVNGSEAVYSMLSKRDVDVIKEEVDANGWSFMRSCLIFPILFHEGIGRSGDCGRGRKSAGMIHAVNKVTTCNGGAGRFTPDDEVLMSMSARTLGCMLTRYPVHFFILRVNDAIREATHPNDGPPSVDGHLPHMSRDIVEDATLVGMKAMLSPQPILILRAPISEIYQARAHRTRIRKLGNLVANDTALPSVEFNLTAMNKLWETGMKDNVLMHQQYRALNEQLLNTRALMRNLLDGLSVTRTMREPEDMARYLQNLELFARSENEAMLSEFIGNTLLAYSGSGAAREKSIRQQAAFTPSPPASATQKSILHRDAPPSQHGTAPTSASMKTLLLDADTEAPYEDDREDDPFLNSTQTKELLWEHRRLNTKVASRIHVDGPEGIRAYSTDPITKRNQMRFIEEVQRKRVAETRRRLQEEIRLSQGPAYLRGTKSQPHDLSHSPPLIGKPHDGGGRGKSRPGHKALPLASTDFATSRPYRV